MAEAVVDQNLGDFDPSVFNDRYQDALLELVKAKVAGKVYEVVEDNPAGGEVVSLMDALRQSVEMEKKPPAKSAKRKAAKKTTG